jgi:hypothetical protein
MIITPRKGQMKKRATLALSIKTHSVRIGRNWKNHSQQSIKLRKECAPLPAWLAWLGTV